MIFLHNIVVLLTVLLVVFMDKCAMSRKPIIKRVFCCGELFEGPHWSTQENALYWVDIIGQKVFRFEPKTDNITSRSIGYGYVTLVVTVKDNPGVVLITSKTGVYMFSWESPNKDSSLRQLTQVDIGQPDNTANDGKVDAKGRLWFGTMGKLTGILNIEPDKGSVYMVDYNNYKNPALKVRPVSLSNGVAWKHDNSYMYYIDSPTRRVDLFDFNLETGDISNRRPFFKFDDYNLSGVPDGMTIDSDGHLWVACFLGGKVIKIDGSCGVLLKQYIMPADQITSVMWGGPNLATLFVTSGRNQLNATQLAKQPYAGSIFSISNTGSRGVPEHQFVFPNASKF